MGHQKLQKGSRGRFLLGAKNSNGDGENRATFESMVASWYYDGKKMHDPFILDKGKTETEWNDVSGRIRMESDGGVYSFGGSAVDFQLDVKTEKVGIELSMQRWNDMMSELVPTGRSYGNMGYSMLKYRGLLSSGRIRVGEIGGSCKWEILFPKGADILDNSMLVLGYSAVG